MTKEMSSQIEIQKTLININEITNKIKKELEMIREMVKDKGNLAVAVEEGNNILARIAKKRGLQSVDELFSAEDIDGVSSDLEMSPVTMDFITQKLMAIMDA